MPFNVDGLRQGPGNVRIGLFIETDVSVTDLDEQRLAQFCSAFLVAGRHGQINRREYSARQREKCAGPAVGHAFEGVAAR
jgi:hypothetical protein